MLWDSIIHAVNTWRLDGNPGHTHLVILVDLVASVSIYGNQPKKKGQKCGRLHVFFR